MGAAITLAGADLIAQKQVAQEGLDVVRFIFANVPGLNHSAAVDRAAGLPPAEQIVHTAIIPAENKGYVNPNQVVYSVQVGSDVGDWDFNWLGLETAEGVLFAVSYVPLQQKRRNIPPLQLGNNLTRNFLVVFDGAQALTGVTIDASTWQHDFTVRLAGIDERERQSNRDVYGRACFFGSSLQLEKVGAVYQLKPGNAYVEGVRLQRSAALPVVPQAFPTTAWLDVALQRELNDVVASWSVVWGAGKVDYVDSAGVQHYCVAIADLPNSNTITDSRPVEDIAGPLVAHFAARVGDYAGLRARATTKADVGLGNLPNAKSDDENTNDSEILATTKAVKRALDRVTGFQLLDATNGPVTVTLPAATAELGIVELTVRRVDATTNAAVIAAGGADKLMLDTTSNAAGQASTELLFAGDWMRLRSDGAGRWWCVGQAQLPSNVATGQAIFTTPGVHSFVVPPVLRGGRRTPTVTVIGGGGGGGGASSSQNYNAAAGGGGAGGSARKLVSLAGITFVTVSVGDGGVGGTSGLNTGTGGETSSFGAYCSATGGTAGNSVAGGVAVAGTAAGGGGGSGTGGAINTAGGGGQPGVCQYPTVAGSTVGGGHGGVSSLSGGNGFGSGGKGAASSANTVAGQKGAPGAVIIEW